MIAISSRKRATGPCYDDLGMSQQPSPDIALIRRWVETWRRAGIELERLRRLELQSVDTQEAVRQIFGSGDPAALPPSPATSGLIEQQAWFARLSVCAAGETPGLPRPNLR